MNSETLKVNLIAADSRAPTRNNSTDAGLDLYSCDSVVIRPGCGQKIRTGIAIQLPVGTVGLILDRSSLGSKGIKVHGGVIDAPYRGEIIVVLWNHAKDDCFISSGDKIAQLVIMNCLFPSVEVVSKLDYSDRGEKGFGSSGN